MKFLYSLKILFIRIQLAQILKVLYVTQVLKGLHNKMKFGKIKNWILVGGEDIVLDTAKFLISKNQKIKIYTGERNLKARLKNGKTLKQNFIASKISFKITKDINKNLLIDSSDASETLILSLSSPWIFKKSTINKFSNRIINLHEADLPINRGGATISWMIMMNTKKSASALHFVTTVIDGGDILMKKRYTFPKKLEIPNDYAKYIFLQSKLLIRNFIKSVCANQSFLLEKNDKSNSTYWPRLNTELQSYINWNWNIYDIYKFIKSFDDPYNGSRSFINNKQIIIKKVKVLKVKSKFHPFQNGVVYKKFNKKLYISLSEGSLIISSVTDLKTKSIMEKIKVGQRFYTPAKYIEKALILRPVYTSEGLRVNRND